MIRMLRTLLIFGSTSAIVAFAAAAVANYRPGDSTTRASAVGSLKRAVAALDDEALDAAERLRQYREGLATAETLLRRAVRSNPADTASIERLASVRWEAGVLAGGPDSESTLSLVSIAAARAPRMPELQANLGTLLYRIGSPDAAAAFMRRAVELSPAMTQRVVTSMQEAGVAAESMASTLPRTVESMLALKAPLDRFGKSAAWLDGVETLLPTHPAELLWVYTDAGLARHEVDRLLANIERLGVLADRGTESRRQLAIGRVRLARAEWELSAAAAVRARALAPRDSRVLDVAGQIALASHDPVTAEAAFRDALAAIALEPTSERDRGRLYRQHGQALEQLGLVDNAFDEYRRAAQLLPDDLWLRQRFAAVTSKPMAETRR